MRIPKETVEFAKFQKNQLNLLLPVSDCLGRLKTLIWQRRGLLRSGCLSARWRGAIGEVVRGFSSGCAGGLT
jgi:hypothetical protein